LIVSVRFKKRDLTRLLPAMKKGKNSATYALMENETAAKSFDSKNTKNKTQQTDSFVFA
jgi:hypothetical protein